MSLQNLQTFLCPVGMKIIDKNFGTFLKAYLFVVNKKAGELAHEINVHKKIPVKI